MRRWEFGLLPAAIWLIVFYGYPVAGSLIQSVTSFISPERAGLDNYRWFFSTSVNLVVLERTFETALLVTAVCVVLGFPYAYLLTIVQARWRAIMLAVVLLPFWTSLLVRSFAWIGLLQQGGPAQRALAALGITQGSPIGTLGGVALGMTQILLPFMVLPLYAVLRTIDRGLLTAAASLGAKPRTAFLKVYVPLAVPGLVAGSVLVFVLSLGFFVTPELLGSPQNSLMSQLIVTQTNTLLAFGRAGAMSAILLAATALALGAAAIFLRRARTHHLYGG